MKALPIQRSMAVMRPEPEGVCAIRVSHRAERKRGTGKISPRYLLRCGCCDQAVQIYYGPEDLEINGVYGSVENWREILLPLLGMRRSGKYFIAETIPRRKPEPSPKRAKESLANQLKKGALANAARDRAMAAEWLPLEEEAAQLAEAGQRTRPRKRR